jgi:hypothetical protein
VLGTIGNLYVSTNWKVQLCLDEHACTRKFGRVWDLESLGPNSDCSQSTWTVTYEGSMSQDRKNKKLCGLNFLPFLHMIVANYLALLWNHLISTGSLLEIHAWGLHVIIGVDHVLGSEKKFTCDQRESCSTLVNLSVNICKQRTVCKWLLGPKKVSGYLA